MKKLNSRERKKLHQQLEEQFGFAGQLDYDIFLNENRMKYYLVTQAAAEFDIEGMRVETLGLYFARGVADGLRLTIEGSQLIGSECAHHVLTLSDEQHALWMRGNDLDVNPELEGWQLLKHNDDFVGCGKVVKKDINGAVEVSLHNYIPKARYVRD